MEREPRVLRHAAVLVLASAAVSGCGTQPQTPDEFRQKMRGYTFGKVQTFEANRPFRDVAKTFQSRAPECLNVRVKRTSQQGTAIMHVDTTLKPTVRVTDKKAELYVQLHYNSQSTAFTGPEPPGGYYIFIADATPLGSTKTRVEYYTASFGYEAIERGVTAWATGKSLGCPDLTK